MSSNGTKLLPAPTAAQSQLETSTWDTLAGSEALPVFYGPSEMTLAPVCHPSCCSLPSRTHLSHWAVTGVSMQLSSPLCVDSVHSLLYWAAVPALFVRQCILLLQTADAEGCLGRQSSFTSQAGKTMELPGEAPLLAGTVMCVGNPRCLGG